MTDEIEHGVLLADAEHVTECKCCGEEMVWNQIWLNGKNSYTDDWPDIDRIYDENGDPLQLAHMGECDEGGKRYHRDEWEERLV